MHSSTGRHLRLGGHWYDSDFHPRDQIRENVLVKQFYCDVDVSHLISYNEELAHRLQTQPADVIPLVTSVILPITFITDDV